MAYRHPWLKIIFIVYRNIFLSQYCVWKCLVWLGPYRVGLEEPIFLLSICLFVYLFISYWRASNNHTFKYWFDSFFEICSNCIAVNNCVRSKHSTLIQNPYNPNYQCISMALRGWWNCIVKFPIPNCHALWERIDLGYIRI